MQIFRKLRISAAIACALALFAHGQTRPATPPLEAEIEQLRTMCVCRLILLRQAIADAEIDDAVRTKLIDVVNDNEKNLDQRIREACHAFQTDGDQTKARVVINGLPYRGIRLTSGDKATSIRVGQQNMILESELQLLKDGKALEEAKKLELSESQQQKIAGLFDEMSKNLKETGPDEKFAVRLGALRVRMLLDVRKQFRDLLSDEQQSAWDDAIREPVVKSYGQLLNDMERRRRARPPSESPKQNN